MFLNISGHAFHCSCIWIPVLKNFLLFTTESSFEGSRTFVYIISDDIEPQLVCFRSSANLFALFEFLYGIADTYLFAVLFLGRCLIFEHLLNLQFLIYITCNTVRRYFSRMTLMTSWSNDYFRSRHADTSSYACHLNMR